MRKRRGGFRWLLAFALVLPVVAPLLPVTRAGAAHDEAFDGVWGSTDAAVANGQANYGWFWGPVNLLQTVEVYISDHGDEREVRYYDKSRMEINNPGGDPSNIYYVTNGLLTVELVTGQLKRGDAPGTPPPLRRGRRSAPGRRARAVPARTPRAPARRRAPAPSDGCRRRPDRVAVPARSG